MDKFMEQMIEPDPELEREYRVERQERFLPPTDEEIEFELEQRNGQTLSKVEGF